MIAPEVQGRADAIARARQQLHSGAFLGDLGRRVAYPTESQNAGRQEVLRRYLEWSGFEVDSFLSSTVDSA